MSAFNTVVASASCPACSAASEFEIQFKHGDTWQYRYHLGDTLRWGGNDNGQPQSGVTRVDGIGGPCPSCATDYLPFVVLVRDDRLEAVIPQPLTASDDQPPITPSTWHPRRAVVTGYYDGPTDGILDFGEEVGVYLFQAVACDVARGRRVLKLARLASDGLDSVVATLSAALGPPRWPLWVPIWIFDDEDTQRAAEAQIDAFCATAGETVMAALTDDGLQTCFSIRTMDERAAAAVSDWLSLFA